MDMAESGTLFLDITRKKKDFQDPGQLQELMKQFGIREHGTNINKEVFNPYKSIEALKEVERERATFKPPSTYKDRVP